MRRSCPFCDGRAHGDRRDHDGPHAPGPEDTGNDTGSEGAADCVGGPPCHGSGSGGRLTAVFPSLADAHHRTRTTADRRVVLVGNPNVGKSSLFNAMLGMKARVMNAPGTTVLLEYGTLRHGDESWDVVDTPGTYSLLPMSPDEDVAAKAAEGAVDGMGPDLIVAVLDASAIGRSLYLLAMLLGLGVPVVVALTMNDLAARNGLRVDPTALSTHLGGAAVVEVDGRTGRGVAALEGAIAGGFAGAPVPAGIPVRRAGEDLQDWVRREADARFDWSARTLSSLGLTTTPRVTVSDRIDRVLLNPWLGIPVFLGVMYLVFEATTTLAGPLQDWIDATLRTWCTRGLDALFGLFGSGALDGWLHGLVVDGLLDGAITVATFIPPMGIMFLLLSLLEDCGYLARAAFVMDRAMRALGLDGRAFLPIVVGFGCNLPALAATRSLTDSRQRVLVGMLIPFASCSARLSVYLVLAYAFFRDQAGLVIFLMYVTSVLVILGVGVLLRRTAFHGLRPEPFAMSLPHYQLPKAVATGRSVVSRLWGFLRGASAIIITVIAVMWVLQGIPAAGDAGSFGHVEDVHDSLYGVIADAVAPVFSPAGFDDWHASAALLTGFVAKEVVVGSMSQSYDVTGSSAGSATDEGGGGLGAALRESFDASSDGHGRAAAVAFLLFVLAYTPCLATVAELRRQFGTTVMASTVATGLVVAYVLAVAAFQLLRLVM